MIKDLSTERARLHRFQPRYIRKDRDITRYEHANINYTDVDGRSKGRVIKWVRAGQSSHVRTDESETDDRSGRISVATTIIKQSTK